MAGPVGATCCSASSLLAFRLLSSRTSNPKSPPLACYYVPEVRKLYGGTGYLPKRGASYSLFTISSIAKEVNYTEQVQFYLLKFWSYLEQQEKGKLLVTALGDWIYGCQ